MSDILFPLRRLHGKIDAFFKQKMLLWGGLSRSKRLSASRHEEPDFPIDFVVLWVDGKDPVWLSKKSQYDPAIKIKKDEPSDDSCSEERFRDWGIFKYWFRAVEKYAPWVNRIFVVTDKQIPSFLNLSNKKVCIIDHSEIIDSQVLPTYNSSAIEINIHKIPGLSEHFIYFNDDVFCSCPLKKSDFFTVDGFPKYSGVAKPFCPMLDSSVFQYIMMNCLAAFNSSAEYDIRKAIASHPEKFFSFAYSKDDRRLNMRLYELGYLTGVYFSHLGVPYRVSSWVRVWEEFPVLLNNTVKNRFRSAFDVNHFIFMLWEILSGSFEPVLIGHYGKACNISIKSVDQLINDFNSKTYRMICVNDSEQCSQQDFPILSNKLSRCLENIFPDCCSFEIENSKSDK